MHMCSWPQPGWLLTCKMLLASVVLVCRRGETASCMVLGPRGSGMHRMHVAAKGRDMYVAACRMARSRLSAFSHARAKHGSGNRRCAGGNWRKARCNTPQDVATGTPTTDSTAALPAAKAVRSGQHWHCCCAPLGSSACVVGRRDARRRCARPLPARRVAPWEAGVHRHTRCCDAATRDT